MPQVIPLVLAVATNAGAYAIISAAVTLALTTYAQQQAKSDAKTSFNASQKDVYSTIVSPLVEKRIVVGRARVSGSIPCFFKSGAKKEFSHFAVVFADHECDAIETIYFNEDVISIDGSGWVTTPKYQKATDQYGIADAYPSGGQWSITLPVVPTSIIGVFTQGSGVEEVDTSQAYTQNGATISGFSGATNLFVKYRYQTFQPIFKITKYLGSAAQQADPVLIANSGGLWTSNHRGDKTTYIQVSLEYDHDTLSTIGLPNITAVLRGLKCFDPRTNTTAWTQNAALISAAVITHPLMEFKSSMTAIDSGELIEAANVCDEPVPISATTTQIRWSANGVISTTETPNEVRQRLQQSMAGAVYWGRGKWSIQAGSHGIPSLFLNEDSFSDISSVDIVTATPKRSKFNTVEGTFGDVKNDYVSQTFSPYTRAAYVTQDAGKKIVQSVEFSLCNDGWQANRLAAALVEDSRRTIIMKAAFKISAYNCKYNDVVSIQCALFGWESAKQFRVKSREFDAENGAILLTLKECDAAQWLWNYQDTADTSQQPNSALPNPRDVAVINGLSASSSPANSILGVDGSVVGRLRVAWNLSTDQAVVNGGRIEIQYSRVADTQFTPAAPAQGSATESFIGPVEENAIYIVRVRAVTGYGVRGDWSYTSAGVGAFGLPPVAPTSVIAAVDSKGILVKWTRGVLAKRYEIYCPQLGSVVTTDSLEYRYPPSLSAGNYQFLVKSVSDRQVNSISQTPSNIATVYAPTFVISSPGVNKRVVGGNLEISWENAVGSFDIDRYIVYRYSRTSAPQVGGGGVVGPPLVDLTGLEPYAQIKTNFLSMVIDWQNTEWFYVVAVDVAGNNSKFGGGINNNVTAFNGAFFYPPFAPVGLQLFGNFLVWQNAPRDLPILETRISINNTFYTKVSASTQTVAISLPAESSGSIQVVHVDTSGNYGAQNSIAYSTVTSGGGGA